MPSTKTNTANSIKPKTSAAIQRQWGHDDQVCDTQIEKYDHNYVFTISNGESATDINIDKRFKESDALKLRGDLLHVVEDYYASDIGLGLSIYKAIFLWASTVIGQDVATSLADGSLKVDFDYIAFRNTGGVPANTKPCSEADFETISVCLIRDGESIEHFNSNKSLFIYLLENEHTPVYTSTAGDCFIKNELLSKINQDDYNECWNHSGSTLTYKGNLVELLSWEHFDR